MAKIQRRDGEQWESIIQAQEQSGMTARVFCEKRRIGLASFYHWRKRLAGGVASARKKPSEKFIELGQAGLAEKSANERPVFEAVLDFGEGISITLRRA